MPEALRRFLCGLNPIDVADSVDAWLDETPDAIGQMRALIPFKDLRGVNENTSIEKGD